MSENPLTEISNGVLLFVPPPDRIAGWRRSGNVIILNKSHDLYIIDSGGPSVRNQLLTIVNSLLSNNGKPVHCIHTHGHIDHMAGARELRENFNADIWASEVAIPFVESQAPINIEMEREFLIVSFREIFTAPIWFVKAAMWVALGRTNSISSVKPLDKSSNIGETGFHLVELPGHHLGHIGAYNEDESILIAGDLIDPRHKMKPILTAPSSDFIEMRTSLETVLQIAPDILLPGHGEPIIGEEEVQSAILKAQETMQAAHNKVIEVLESKPSTLPELSNLLLRMGLGPGDVFRRMFIHSILRHLVSIEKVSKQQSSRGKTIFSI
jgi:glyoxylase-like metal-dependent hydrolase (beta-lactamase superfamily II)